MVAGTVLTTLQVAWFKREWYDTSQSAYCTAGHIPEGKYPMTVENILKEVRESGNDFATDKLVYGLQGADGDGVNAGYLERCFQTTGR